MWTTSCLEPSLRCRPPRLGVATQPDAETELTLLGTEVIWAGGPFPGLRVASQGGLREGKRRGFRWTSPTGIRWRSRP
ncbi:hypothetical protein SAMN00790413_02516 [Deinococcus hopiensis KR-140]|uniref:Uncharacterized protein n=1 Tax=Deinococcus hopiensis KR-140 TaxID=695939 RepID=A0A1W1VN65_9DEIO|nr:hypothetical protein SAMN00790413_02516 [Deinococcus hopiensis KR-140]